MYLVVPDINRNEYNCSYAALFLKPLFADWHKSMIDDFRVLIN